MPPRVVPEEAVASSAPDGRQLRAPLLRRLQEIDSTIKALRDPGSAPDNLDGYKTLPLHTAARRGDMREIAQLLPSHAEGKNMRDESGWMPLHHASCAGRRVIFRIPCATTKMVDLAEREAIMDEVCALVTFASKKAEAEQQADGDDEPTGGGGGGGGGGRTFSKRMEMLLNDYLPDAPTYRSAPSAAEPARPRSAPPDPPPTSAAPGKKRPPSHKSSGAGSLAPIPDAQPVVVTDAGAGKRAEAAALKQLKEERPKGVWIEIAWTRPGQHGAAGAPAAPAALASAAAEVKERSFIEIVLLQLHDSEYESHVPRASGVGKLLASAPLDVAMVALSRGLSVWPPTVPTIRECFEEPDLGGSLVSSAKTLKFVGDKFSSEDDYAYDEEEYGPYSLLKGALSRVGAKSTITINALSIDGPSLSVQGGAWRDFFVRATPRL